VTVPHQAAATPKIYRHLFPSFVCNLDRGVAGIFPSVIWRSAEAAGRHVYPGDQDGHRADHLLYRRPWHRQHERPKEGRPRRAEGDRLFRGDDDTRPDCRSPGCQSVATRGRHECRSGHDRSESGSSNMLPKYTSRVRSTTSRTSSRPRLSARSPKAKSCRCFSFHCCSAFPCRF
jgi:hypothetical protein